MVITAEQIRAALGALNWSRRMLSEKSSVTPRTIQRIAESRGVPNSSAKYLDSIAKAFEQGDEYGHIEFTNSDAPGIRFHSRDAGEKSVIM